MLGTNGIGRISPSKREDYSDKNKHAKIMKIGFEKLAVFFSIATALVNAATQLRKQTGDQMSLILNHQFPFLLFEE